MVLKNKRGNILTEYVIFIILNLVFLSILILFVFSKTGGAAILEEKYSKQIALILDSAKPGVTIQLNMEDALKKKDDIFEGKIVTIEDNVVTVRLREKGGYSYHFFNDVVVEGNYFDEDTKELILIINKYKNE